MWKKNTRYHIGNISFGYGPNRSVNAMMGAIISKSGDGTFEVTETDRWGNAIEFKCGMTGKILNKDVVKEEFDWKESHSFLFWVSESMNFKEVDYVSPVDEPVVVFNKSDEIHINRILKSEEDRLALIELLNKVTFK